MIAVLDACVLYPPLLRNLLLTAADRGHFEPRWSARILGEWLHAASRDGVPADPVPLRAHWPGAEVVPLPLDAILPDEDDVHVLAACVTCRAGFLVTRNHRDFPTRTLARFGVARADPDPFLSAFAREDAGVLAPLDAIPPGDRRGALRQAGLGRLARLIA